MAELVWDPRLLTPARALELAGAHLVYATFQLSELSQFETDGYASPYADENGRLPDQWQINLRCQQCHQSVGLLATGMTAYNTSISDLLAGVLRHLVMAHNVSLSGGGADVGQRQRQPGNRAAWQQPGGSDRADGDAGGSPAGLSGHAPPGPPGTDDAT